MDMDFEIGDVSTWPTWFRLVAVVVVGLAIIYAGYHFFISTEQEKLRALQLTEQDLKEQFMVKKKLVINLPAYKQQMVEIVDRFGVILQQLPDKTEVPALLVDISQAGLARGLDFEMFKPNELRNEQFYATLPISLEVSGKFHQLAEFVSDLSALPRIVTVGNMKITSENDETDKLKMSATLSTFQYLEDGGVDEEGEGEGSKKARVKSG